MAKGLKQELGLGEPSKKASDKTSTKQSDKFKKAFKATLKKVNSHLEYTAARAEEARHKPLAQKRDKAYATYQAVLKKIDHANPAATQTAIDQVTASIEGLEANAKTLHEYAEKHYTAWTDNQQQFDDAVAQVTEMVEWGHAKGSALEQVVAGVNEQANLRKYKEAVEALNRFLGKLGPIHEEFVSQYDAKVAYERMREDKRLTLEDFAAVDFVSLSEWQTEIVTHLDTIQRTAEGLDYVTAFDDLEAELLAVEEFLAEASQLQKSKEEYEASLAELQTRLDKGAGWDILHVQENINRLTAEMEQAATDEDFVGALEKLNELSPEVDLKLQLIDKEIYESSARTYAAAFTTADGTDDLGFYPLKKAKEGYTAAKKELDDFVATEKWQEASGKLPDAAAAAQALIDQRAGFDECDTEYRRIKPDIDYVTQLNKNAPRNPEWNEELKLLNAFNNHFNNGDFDQALADMQALESKVAALRTRVAASDAVAAPKAAAAADEIRALAGGRNVSSLSNDEKNSLIDELRKLSPKKQRQLLEDLHMPSTPLTTEQRAMQIAMYNAMTLDKKFEKADKKICDRYQVELSGDEELTNAINDWNGVDASGVPLVDRETKEKLLKRIVATQSKAYGIDVPEIEWTDPSAPFAGQFKPSTGRLMLNPQFLSDPHAIIQAAIHENTHNFQDELVKKYMDGKIKKQDPMYEQAKTFAATYGDDAYVEATEDAMAYEFQPKEMHATDVGIFGADALIYR